MATAIEIELANSGRGVDRQPRRRRLTPYVRQFSLVHQEDQDGVKTVEGKKGAVAVVFSGKSFLRNITYLEAISTDFASRNLGWSEEATRPIIGRALSVDRLTGSRELTTDVIEMIMDDPRKAAQVPSVMLIRKALSKPGDYFATSSQRVYFIPTRMGEKRVFFHILRAVDEGFRGDKVGRWMVDLGFNKHDADFYIHRSSNPMALDTNRKSPNLVQTDRIPYDKLYTDDPIAYEVGRTVLAITVGEAYVLEPTGVVRGLYREQNTAYKPNPRFPDTFGLFQRMTRPVSEGGWGMDLAAGDTLMPFYRV